MKRALVVGLFSLLPTFAYAQDGGSPYTLYTELAVGASFIPTVSTKVYTVSDGIDTASGKIDLNYDTALTAGVEFGLARVGVPELRIGVAYEFVQARFDNGEVVGTLNGVPGSLSFNRSDVASFGIDLDNDVHLVTGNIYYDLPNWGALTPYLGGGIGAAFIEHANAELALTATAGVRAWISDYAYLGLRYRYYYISGPTDDFGIQYNGISNHSIMVLFGMAN